jgi:peptidoglycan/xylan/chitin deacetylase (PgdA/CDA1 family)
MRIDRFATLNIVGRIRRSDGSKRASIPILMYHSVAEEEEPGTHPYYRTITSPKIFAEHMQALHAVGYRTISVADAVNSFQNESSENKLFQNQELSAKNVVITFDDGFADFYRFAFPAMNRYGFSATVFLPTAFIGDRPLQFKGKDCLTWPEVRELRKCGILFGSHTVTHPQLSGLDPAAVKREIVDSKTEIQNHLGESVDSFAYPFAFPEENISFVQMLREQLAGSGYRQGVSTRIGTARSHEDRFFLRRLPINSMDDSRLFKAKLEGKYDWLGKVQHGFKLLKKLR